MRLLAFADRAGSGGLVILVAFVFLGFALAAPIGWLMLLWIRKRYQLKKTSDQTIKASFVWSEWSDFYGHRDEAAFTAALQDVAAMGLSFGGGCFFENGVGIEPGTGSGYFRLMDFSTTPSTADDPLASVVPEVVLAPFVVPTLISIP